MDGATFGERWLSIKLSTEKVKKSWDGPSQKQEGCTTVFIGNLSWDVDEAAIRETFEGCGEIKEIRFSEDRETGRFKGFGHVEFVDTMSTDKAVALAGQDVAGRPIRVDFAAVKERKPFNAGGGGGGKWGGRGGGDRSPRGNFGGRERSNSPKPVNKNKGSIGEFKGNKITFD